MQALNLRFYQYRNLCHQQVDFCPATNLFCGQNGQGKTNILEAVYLLGYGRSFRTASPRDCIQYGSTGCRLEGKIEHGSMTRELAITISQSEEKKLLVHHKAVGLAEFIGNFHTLAFTQEHLRVVRGGPAERRAFLDRAMLTTCPGHIQRLAGYGRALRQRNHLLVAAGRGARADREQLDSWDEKLIQEGTPIVLNRRNYVARLREEFVNPFCRNEDFVFRYSSRVTDADAADSEVEGDFRRRLREARGIDERKGFTTVGPHRDDLLLMLDGRPLADFGSAGQQRSCLLALYFSQMEIHRKACGFYPVFLMDDVEAELDSQRLQAFLEHLAKRTQTFLTTAKEQLLPPLGADVLQFRVDAGRIEPVGRSKS